MPIEKTYIEKGLTTNQIEKKYGIPHATAYVSKMRGYITKRVKLINISEKDFDYKDAKKAARHVFFNYISHLFRNPLDLFDDLQQASILRCYELSGETNKHRFNHYCSVAKYAMLSLLQEECILGIHKGKFVSFEDNVLGKGIYQNTLQIEEGEE